MNYISENMNSDERNKGHTQEMEDQILIPRSLISQLDGSLNRILSLVDLEKSDTVQQEDVKNIYLLLECIFKNVKK